MHSISYCIGYILLTIAYALSPSITTTTITITIAITITITIHHWCLGAVSDCLVAHHWWSYITKVYIYIYIYI